MRTHLRPVVLSLLMLELFCTSHPASHTEQTPAPGMVIIASKGHSFTMGTMDQRAGDDEKPPMTVAFSYHFEIDTAEVTARQFHSTMGYLPKEYRMDDSTSGKPVCFVTWFDAVLFCNQKSLSSGLDTVYRYLNIEKLIDKRTYRINGFSADFSRSGYRLPTEAEWEYCARAGTASAFCWGDGNDTVIANTYAWSLHNSGDEAHDVCTRKPNRFGIYDMAGNAMEWVSDWKTTYKSGSITNFTGGKEAGTGLRPVKGGSFAHTINKLRPSSRSDEYATISTTAIRYIGFRCCKGAIPDPSYLYPQTITNPQDSAALTVTSPHPLSAGKGLKAVCVASTSSGSALCGIDITGHTPRSYQYTDIPHVYLPTISPDGKRVAFCTRDEGSHEGSEIYLRKLDATGSELIKLDDAPAFAPRWWVDPALSDTFIVYTTSAVLNTSVNWQATKTMMQKISGGKPVGAPLVLETNGSFHGGLSSDRRYLATGYPLLKMKELPHGETRTLFIGPHSGKPAGDTSQVCNVSISPGSTTPDRVLFLDFGSGAIKSTLTGGSYGTHAVLFMGDFSGKVTRWYTCPEGTIAWDCPEWTNRSRYAVACVKTVAEPERRSAVYLIDLDDSTYTPFLSGTDLRHPYVWIADSASSPPETFSRDSAGLYDEPPSQVSQATFAIKMPMFWEFIDSTEVLFVGSSRMENSGVPSEVAPYFGLNMSYSGCGMLGARHVLEDYALRHCRKLKAVVMSLDICWYNTPGGDETWLTGTENTLGYTYDRHHDFWSEGIPDGFVGAVNDAVNVPETVSALRGWNKLSWNGKGWGDNPIPVPAPWAWSMDDNVTENLAALRVMAEHCQKNGIQFIGILLPMSPHFKTTEVYGAFGPSRETARRIIAGLQEIDSAIGNFTLYDANASGDHDFEFEDFEDASHLNAQGGVKLSGRLKTLLIEKLQ